MSDTAIKTLNLPNDVDDKNAERAGWARAALDAYCAQTRGGTTFAEHDADEVLGDFLNDLRHLLDVLIVDGLFDEAYEDEAEPGVSDGAAAFAAFADRDGHYLAETGRADY